MKVFIHYALVLLIITGLACGILAMVNKQTKPVIEKNQAESENNARSQVIEGAVDFEKQSLKINETKSLDYYIAKDAQANVLGYTFIAIGKGYSGELKTMVGVDPDFKIKKILVIQQTETPGLGANCTKPEFNEKFANLTFNDLKVDKDGGNIKSISGATITTRAITNSIKETLDMLQKNLNQSVKPVQNVQDTLSVQQGVEI
ncbi:MAG TPA: RnfABCDGE type electron transport complex subunit G [Candidatus Cloacimonadota bacterium]|nr:RnfABCDGE type electron transport complex subunit G [Candidatus Cloacimonadota bacterium]HPM01847.1 RnfABCDGE type electron transport complex subunit G [Candidatus Cloacimonadota bacterium]